MKITDEELAALPAKTKKHQAVVELYRKYDFLEAYAKHTDIRVAENPEGAIGNHLEWDKYGELQKSFLISQGLKPQHRLLDIGCGTGRLARKVGPYLDAGLYVGVDLSPSAIQYAQKLSVSEGWCFKDPKFYVGWDLSDYDSSTEWKLRLDFLWAFSVFIHLPGDVVRSVIADAAKMMHAGSKFLFSYVPEKVNIRTGLKQFRWTIEFYIDACSAAGLTFKEVKWPGAQKIALATLK